MTDSNTSTPAPVARIIDTPYGMMTIPANPNFIFMDDSISKIVTARVKEVPKMPPIIIWSGNAYDAIGEWTQAQAVTLAQIKISAFPAK